MFNIADLPAVQAQLAKDAAAVEQLPSGGPLISQPDPAAVVTQPEQASTYPSKTLVLVGGRYHAVNRKK